MIEKEKGNPKIHRLRVIHLYEADYNFIVGLKWRNMIFDSEEKGIIAEGQYGARPGCSAHDPVFIEEMQNEITRCCCKPLVKFDNDATSCYDRIICNLAALLTRKHGVHRHLCIILSLIHI